MILICDFLIFLFLVIGMILNSGGGERFTARTINSVSFVLCCTSGNDISVGPTIECFNDKLSEISIIRAIGARGSAATAPGTKNRDRNPTLRAGGGESSPSRERERGPAAVASGRLLSKCRQGTDYVRRRPAR